MTVYWLPLLLENQYFQYCNRLKFIAFLICIPFAQLLRRLASLLCKIWKNSLVIFARANFLSQFAPILSLSFRRVNGPVKVSFYHQFCQFFPDTLNSYTTSLRCMQNLAKFINWLNSRITIGDFTNFTEVLI